MKKLLVLIVIIAGVWFLFFRDGTTANPESQNPPQVFQPDSSNATFVFDGEPVTLSDGVSDENDMQVSLLEENATGDLNADGKADSVALLASSGGGSGVFIYIAAYVSGPISYKGTEAIFIGDRVSPQNVSVANGVVTLNYLDRKSDEPFAAEPTVPVSKQFVYRNGTFQER